MLGLDSGNGYGNRRSHYACYELLEEGVHDLRVSCDFVKTGNCSRELVCVCELGQVVKTRRSGCCYFCSSFKNVKKKVIYWLSSSYAIDKLLQDKIDARSLCITCVVLKLVDGIGKALSFC